MPPKSNTLKLVVQLNLYIVNIRYALPQLNRKVNHYFTTSASCCVV